MKKEVLNQLSLVLLLPIVLLLGYYIQTGNRVLLALSLLTALIAFLMNAYSD